MERSRNVIITLFNIASLGDFVYFHDIIYIKMDDVTSPEKSLQICIL